MSSNAVRNTRPERVPRTEPESSRLTPTVRKKTTATRSARNQPPNEQISLVPKHLRCHYNNNNNNNTVKPKYDPYGTDVYNFQGNERQIQTRNSARPATSTKRTELKRPEADVPRRFNERINTDRLVSSNRIRSKSVVAPVTPHLSIRRREVGSLLAGQKQCSYRGQGGSGSSKNNNPGSLPPAAPLKNASSVSSLDSKHQKSGLLKFSGSKDRGLDTRTLGKEKTSKKILGSRDKGLDKLGSREKGLDKLVPSNSRDRGLERPPSNVESSRDKNLHRLGQGDNVEIGDRRQDQLGAVANNLEDAYVNRDHFARGDTVGRDRDFEFHKAPIGQHKELTRGLSAASDDQELTRDFQSLPYDFATSVMIQQKQSHTEQANAMLQQEIESLHRQLDTAAQTRLILESRLDEQRSIHGSEIKALEHALDTLREKNSGLEQRLGQSELLIENERREHASRLQIQEKLREAADMEQELIRVREQMEEVERNRLILEQRLDQSKNERKEMAKSQLQEKQLDAEKELVKMKEYLKEVETSRALQTEELERERLILEQERETLKQERVLWEQEKLEKLADRMHDRGDNGEMVELLQVPDSAGGGNRRLHSSAPASIAVSNSQDDNTLATACPTPEWEKNTSCKSLDHMSVACLQVKIHEMEETHHSTNEELQATLQELSDLQSQLSEMQSHNERLKEEKNSLYQSLLQQNEEKQNSATFKDEVYDAEMKELKESFAQINADNLRMKERLLVLEGTLDGAMADKKDLEEMLLRSRDESSEKDIEINRLSMLLENAKTKIVELENDRDRDDNKTDLGELLAATRKEKDDLRSMLADLQEQLSKSHCEVARLKDQVLTLQEDCMVIRNNAKCALSDLQYKYEQLVQEKRNVTAELQMQQEAFTGFQEQNAQLAQECRLLQSGVEQARLELRDAQQQLQQEQRSRQEEHAEWEQFQTDLLMTVRVANNFKVEAQEQIEQLKVENEGLKNYVMDLECKVNQMKDAPSAISNSEDAQRSPTALALNEMETKDTLIRLHVTKSNLGNTADVIQKPPYARQDSRVSVKCLIEDIEKQAAQKLPTKHLSSVDKTSSANSSTGSLNSLSNVQQSTNDIISTLSPTNNRDANWADTMFEQNTQSGHGYVKNPLREQSQQNKYQYLSKTTPVTPKTSMKLYNTHPDVVAGGPTYAYLKSNYKSTHGKTADEQKISDYTRRSSHGDQVAEHRDPLNALYANGGSKRNALLKWCQERTAGYRNIDITNFSSSWNDGMALCALLHTYIPDRIPYGTLVPNEKRRNFSLAFAAAESVGIPTSLNINDMIQLERPDWHQVMAYVIAIYKHFEV